MTTPGPGRRLLRSSRRILLARLRFPPISSEKVEAERGEGPQLPGVHGKACADSGPQPPSYTRCILRLISEPRPSPCPLLTLRGVVGSRAEAAPAAWAWGPGSPLLWSRHPALQGLCVSPFSTPLPARSSSALGGPLLRGGPVAPRDPESVSPAGWAPSGARRAQHRVGTLPQAPVGSLLVPACPPQAEACSCSSCP